jgi:hypothetical protein
MNRSKSLKETKYFTTIPVLMMALVTLTLSARGSSPAWALDFENKAQDKSQEAGSTRTETSNASKCASIGEEEISITCDYGTAKSDIKSKHEPQIMLNHASFAFKTNNESHMRIELTFTNAGKTRMADAHTVYVAIDDEKGQNHMRRPLPQVDFRKLEPNQPVTFSDILLAPAFAPGRYTISLWIPNPASAVKFDPGHNFLLSNPKMANPASGLNTIATFTATARAGH